jgi:hypothetical protein
MKRTRIMGLCLATVCATFALSGSSAFATEGSIEFGKCLKFPVGGKAQLEYNYKNGGCTKKAGGALEEHKFFWEPLAEHSTTVALTSLKKTGTGNAVLEGESGIEISCAEQSEKLGEYGPGSTEVKNVVGEFAGCKALGGECESELAGKEKINTLKLHGEPGIVERVPANEEKNTDGADLRGQVSEFLAEFSCAGAAVLVKGGVVVKAGSVVNGVFKKATNKMQNKTTVEFIGVKPGEQEPSEWTALGSGVSNSGGRKFIEENLVSSVAPKGFEESAQSLITIQKSKNSAQKLELRQCKQNVC